MKGRHVASRDLLFYEFPDGSTAPINAWMADADFCARLSLGPPMASLAALTELRSLLDALKREQCKSGQGIVAELSGRSAQRVEQFDGHGLEAPDRQDSN